MRKILILLVALTFVVGPVTSAATVVTPTSIATPNSSWRLWSIATTRGTFTANVVAINLENPKLHISTLTGSAYDCKNNCPVAPLQKYVQRVQGFAGINGTYFCPYDYAACAGQYGSYYWMVYNSVRHTFVNAYQNKFNRGPLVAFDTENHWHFWREAKDWPGLTAFQAQYDTKLTALISNGPALVMGSKVVVTSSELDTKQRTVKGPRSGLGFKGKNAYLIVASSATVLDLAAVMHAFKMEYAINLDGGGSSALYYLGKYRVGPGRNIPNALLFSEVLVQ
ncbi:MAG: phosphodiester glycosidase family protein [Patescibacteria group bacterium]